MPDLIKSMYLVEDESEPSSPFAGLCWRKPSTGELKMRNTGNTGWMLLADLTNEAAGGYSISLFSGNAATTTDAATLYFGGQPSQAPTTTAGQQRVYIPRAGRIKSAIIHGYAATAGTNESWELFIRKNNSSDTSIQALAASTNSRIWSNTALNITVATGDYIEIKSVNLTWATNPANLRFGGWIYIE